MHWNDYLPDARALKEMMQFLKQLHVIEGMACEKNH